MLKRARNRAAMRYDVLKPRSRLDGIILGLTLIYFFWGSLLLRCGDVETNPGPDRPQGQQKESRRQTTLRQCKLGGGISSREESTERAGSAAMVSGQASPAPKSASPVGIPSMIDTTPCPPRGGATSQPVKEPTLGDVIGMLQAQNAQMDTRFDEVKQNMDGVRQHVQELVEEVHVMREDYAAMQGELRGLREEVSNLRDKNQELEQTNDNLMERVDNLERKTDDLEGRSKRNNLIFYGLYRRENETAADCESNLRDFITDKMELSQDFQFDRVHRLNSKADSPMIARCTLYKQKMELLKAKQKLRGTNVFVGEDFSFRVREIRRRLTPHLKKARSDGRHATLIFDHLLIDGKRYTVSSNGTLVDVK